MSHENIELIKTIYGHFNAREYDNIIPHFDDNMTWVSADNSPLADESPYHGPQKIRERVFGRIEAGFEKLEIRTDEINGADGGRVVVLGYYIGRMRGKIEDSETQLAHIWTIDDGKAVKFQQYVDTFKIAELFK